MTRFPRLPVGTLFALLVFVPGARADGTRILLSPLVDHPVHHPVTGRSAHAWRSSVGQWGETYAEQLLRLRGFDEVIEVKTGGNQGIDRIAIKRDARGAIKEVKFLEVKTTLSSKPRLNQTKVSGQQMSREWLAERLKSMRNSGDPKLRKLAHDISQFRKVSGTPIESMGEIMHINPKTGHVTGYAIDGKAVKHGPQSVEHSLKEIQRRGSPAARRWATRALSQWDQIKAETMTSYLGKSAAKQGEEAIVRSSTAGLKAGEAVALGQTRRVAVKKIIQRSAGPLALVASFAFDAKELYDAEYAYYTGAISARQRTTRVAMTVGGMAGAFAGATAGGAAGAWIGAFGGPAAWITVPAGGFFGATIGGIGGYFGGSSIAESSAKAWYQSVDASILKKAESAWLAEAFPVD